jgi:hypothetical protein
MNAPRKAPKAIRQAPGIIPVVWRGDCGQFNNVKDARCISCGGVKS